MVTKKGESEYICLLHSFKIKRRFKAHQLFYFHSLTAKVGVLFSKSTILFSLMHIQLTCQQYLQTTNVKEISYTF